VRVGCEVMSLAILTELRIVTDGQTDGSTRAIAYRAGVT